MPITRRQFLGGIAAFSAAVAFPFKWAKSKLQDHHVYCDAQHGSDLNDGRTPETPTRSIEAAINALPPAGRNLICHMRGSFTFDKPFPPQIKRKYKCMLFDGDSKAWEPQR